MTVLASWKCDVSRKQAAAVQAAIETIDSEAVFVRHYAAGNQIHGWIERPNDGTNDQLWRRSKNQYMVDLAVEILGKY